MDDTNLFKNVESDSEDEDPTKAFKTIWIGIANSTDQNLKVATWTHCSIPDSTSDLKLGAGLGMELSGAASANFKMEKKSRELKQDGSGEPRETEDLGSYDYRKFVINSDTHNASKIITVHILKADATGNNERFWTINLEHRHGLIVVEQEGQLKVVRANGQYWADDRWKPHRQTGMRSGPTKILPFQRRLTQEGRRNEPGVRKSWVNSC
eukprot:GFUD01033740.1.p1 GENE.GFUD01033740.1~~GFUD01033740.1.p1  ORF type:complete len:210 (+),score=40.11 GFUD01033740.1:43-672(+)